MRYVIIFLVVLTGNMLIFGYHLALYVIEVRRFLKFSREDHYQTWEYLTTYKKLGSGFRINPFRAFVYFAQEKRCDDIYLEQARQRVKGRLVSTLIAYGSVVVTPILFAVYIISRG